MSRMSDPTRDFNLRPLVAILAFAGMALAVQLTPAPQEPLFAFHSNPWLNLHHFVRLAARGGVPGEAAPAGLFGEERTQWTAGVEFYRPYAQRDLLFDDGMVAINDALHGAEGKATLEGVAIDADLRATLERLMPIYRKYWWAEHDRSNREWIAAAQPLIDFHGMAIRQALTRTYGVSWPARPIDVDLSVTAGPNGAYSSSTPPHVTLSSTDLSYRGYHALEMLFHESSHTLGLYPGLIQGLTRAAQEQHVTIPRQLWHAVLFYTAGELTRRELRTHGVEYIEYADAGLYKNLCGAGCREKIVEHWRPHLDGKRSMPDALAALAGAFR
jgi:hypothetical protein